MKTTASNHPTSSEIDRRLKIVSQLRNLCLSLGQAKPMTPKEEQPFLAKSQAAPTPVSDDEKDVPSTGKV